MTSHYSVVRQSDREVACHESTLARAMDRQVECERSTGQEFLVLNASGEVVAQMVTHSLPRWAEEAEQAEQARCLVARAERMALRAEQDRAERDRAFFARIAEQEGRMFR